MLPFGWNYSRRDPGDVLFDGPPDCRSHQHRADALVTMLLITTNPPISLKAPDSKRNVLKNMYPPDHPDFPCWQVKRYDLGAGALTEPVSYYIGFSGVTH